MKKVIATIFIVGSTFALSACDTAQTGNIDTQPPYTMERTVPTKEQTTEAAAVTPVVVAPAERVFQRAQTK